MADMTLDALMRQALAGQQQKKQSLSDRMAEIDKYAAQVAPNKRQQYGDAMSMNAPLANPLTMISNQLSDGDIASSTRRAYEADLDSNQNELYKILGLLQNQEQFDKEYGLKAAEAMTSPVTVNSDGSIAINEDSSEEALLLSSVMQGRAKLKDLTPTVRAKVLALAEKNNITLQSPEDSEKESVLNLLSELEGYYTANDNNVSNDLSTGSWLQGKIMGAKAKFNKNENAKLYKDTLEAMTSQLKQIAGDVGIMTDLDAKRLQKMLPTFDDSPSQAAKKWANVKSAVEYKYKNPNKPLPTGGVSANQSKDTNNDPFGVR